MARWALIKVVFVICILCLPSLGSAEVWTDAVAQIKKDNQQTQDEALDLRQRIIAERKRLTKKLGELNRQVADEEKELARQKQFFEELLEQEKKLQARLDDEQEEVKTLVGTLRTGAKTAENIATNSMLSAETGSSLEQLGPLLNPESFPTMDSIQAMVDLYFSELKASGEITKYSGEFVNENGKLALGEILRIGKFTAYYKTDDSKGFLRYDPENLRFVAVSGNLPWGVGRNIDNFITGKSDQAPLDLSDGVVFEQLSSRRTFVEWLNAGGILVWPIIIVGLAALILICERLLFLWRLSRKMKESEELLTQLDKPIANKQWQVCQNILNQKPNHPTVQVIKAGIKHADEAAELIESALQEAILKQLPKLERFLPTLTVLASIAPLLGLLGTVTGMINTFQVITLFGSSDPRMMSGGISEALITTQLGLAVAIPIIIVHHFLERQIDRVIGNIEEKAMSVGISLQRKQAA